MKQTDFAERLTQASKSKNPTDSARPGCVGCLLPRGVNVNPVPRTYTIVMYTGM